MPELTLKEKANGSEEKSKEEGVKEVVANLREPRSFGSRKLFLGPRSFVSGN
jgi:hypothetical protein